MIAVSNVWRRSFGTLNLAQLLARKPAKVAAVALANKMARIAWALLTKKQTYRAPTAVT
jgi:hypothetical protein